MGAETSKTLVIPAIEETLVIPDSITRLRNEIVSAGKSVRAVFDDHTAKAATNALRDFQSFRLKMDKVRVLAKDPYKTRAERVDQIVKDFTAETGCGSGATNQGPEERRLTALLTAHEANLRRQREAAQKKIDDEKAAAVLAEKEKQKEIDRRNKEAEQKKKDAEELLAKAARARTETGKENATQAAAEALQQAAGAEEAAEALALELEEAALDRERQTETQIAIPMMPSAVTSKVVWDFEVLNAVQFAAHDPELCKIEPKRREILEAINAGQFDVRLAPNESLEGDAWEASILSPGIIRAAPGLRIFKSDKISIR